MKQPYFILVVAHSLHGRLRRIHVSQRILYVVFALALVGLFSIVGFLSSYARMAWKVANYNALRQEITALRARYHNLQTDASQTNHQLAELQVFASEVSMAYGLKQKLEGPEDISSEGRLVPTLQESFKEYDFLRSANLSAYSHRYPRSWQTNIVPAVWPVDGRLQSAFGRRMDPFSGEGALHRGVDIGAPYGTPVHASADGVVVFASIMNGFGRVVVVDHGNGFQTYYAHLSRFAVVAGQEVRQGGVIGDVGQSGRATSPHLHYEVRRFGTPQNPVHYLNRSMAAAQSVHRDFPF
jgi:murein DD-endopeptidase MepM/ murein hydrolase activator NlpD